MIIKRIGPISCARIAGVIYAALGLVIGAFVSLFALLGAAFSGAAQTGLGASALSPLIGMFVGIGAIIFCPLIYGLIGFIGAFIGAWLYNLVASKVGGIEIDVA